MRREMEEIREKVHTTADAALFLCFQELNGSHSKGVIRLPLLHYDVPFAGYGEMLLRMNRIYDLLGMPDAGSRMRRLREEEKDEWEFTEEMENRQETTLPAGTERMVSIQIQFRQHCSLQGFLISTDKAVNPTNIMGASKRLCEMVIQMIGKHSTTEFAAVRFGNVLGSNGSVIPLFRRQIEHGGPVTVTHPDIIRYFMTIPEAVSLVLEAGAYAKNGQIFVLNMGDPVRIADLAKNMIRLSGYEPGVEIEIKYIGLRPGEKLYEELLMNEEGMQTTENSRIFIGRQIAFDETVFRKQMKELERAAENECPDICERVKRMVPEYQYEGEKKHDGPSYTYSAGG